MFETKCDTKFIFKSGVQNEKVFNFGSMDLGIKNLYMTHVLSATISGGRFVV